MTDSRSDADRQAQGADGYTFEDYVTELFGLPPLTDAERRELALEGASV